MDEKYGFNPDSTGFLSQECPSCERRFKVQFKIKADGDESRKLAHCPYCDHDGEGCWWTPDQAKYGQAVGARYFSEQLNAGMRARGSKAWKPGPLPTVPPSPIETDNDLPNTAVFGCCNETIRHDASVEKLRCILCATPQA